MKITNFTILTYFWHINKIALGFLAWLGQGEAKYFISLFDNKTKNNIKYNIFLWKVEKQFKRCSEIFSYFSIFFYEIFLEGTVKKNFHKK